MKLLQTILEFVRSHADWFTGFCNYGSLYEISSSNKLMNTKDTITVFTNNAISLFVDISDHFYHYFRCCEEDT